MILMVFHADEYTLHEWSWMFLYVADICDREQTDGEALDLQVQRHPLHVRAGTTGHSPQGGAVRGDQSVVRCCRHSLHPHQLRLPWTQ